MEEIITEMIWHSGLNELFVHLSDVGDDGEVGYEVAVCEDDMWMKLRCGGEYTIRYMGAQLLFWTYGDIFEILVRAKYPRMAARELSWEMPKKVWMFEGLCLN